MFIHDNESHVQKITVTKINQYNNEDEEIKEMMKRLNKIKELEKNRKSNKNEEKQKKDSIFIANDEESDSSSSDLENDTNIEDKPQNMIKPKTEYDFDLLENKFDQTREDAVNIINQEKQLLNQEPISTKDEIIKEYVPNKNNDFKTVFDDILKQIKKNKVEINYNISIIKETLYTLSVIFAKTDILKQDDEIPDKDNLVRIVGSICSSSDLHRLHIISFRLLVMLKIDAKILEQVVIHQVERLILNEINLDIEERSLQFKFDVFYSMEYILKPSYPLIYDNFIQKLLTIDNIEGIQTDININKIGLRILGDFLWCDLNRFGIFKDGIKIELPVGSEYIHIKDPNNTIIQYSDYNKIKSSKKHLGGLNFNGNISQNEARWDNVIKSNDYYYFNYSNYRRLDINKIEEIRFSKIIENKDLTVVSLIFKFIMGSKSSINDKMLVKRLLSSLKIDFKTKNTIKKNMESEGNTNFNIFIDKLNQINIDLQNKIENEMSCSKISPDSIKFNGNVSNSIVNLSTIIIEEENQQKQNILMKKEIADSCLSFSRIQFILQKDLSLNVLFMLYLAKNYYPYLNQELHQACLHFIE